MTAARSPILTGMLLSAMAYAGYTCFDTTIKYTSRHLPTFQCLAAALFASLIFLVIFSFIIHRKNVGHEFTIHKWKLHAVRGLVQILSQSFFFIGFTHIPLTTFYIVLFLVPIMAGIMGSLFLKEKFTAQLALTSLISFCGTLIALRPWTSMHADMLPWVGMVFLGTIFSSCSILIMRRMMVTEGVAATALSNVAIMLCVFLVPATLHYVPFEWHDLVFLTLGGFFYAGAVKALALALRHTPTSYVAAGQFMQLVYGAIAGYLVFSDKPDMWVYVGGAVVIGANLFLLATQSRKPKAEVLGSPA